MSRDSEEQRRFLFNNELIAQMLPSGLVSFDCQIGGLNPEKPLKNKCKLNKIKPISRTLL